jgi:CheY-like chemotaxis protein
MHRVLLAEDNKLNQIVAAGTLQKLGYDVEIVDGGVDAVQACRHNRFDVILMDVMMPDMDGLTTFRHMQDDPDIRHIPVILVTAKVQVGDRQVWDGLAISGVISKPFDPMTLAEQVGQMLGWDA